MRIAARSMPCLQERHSPSSRCHGVTFTSSPAQAGPLSCDAEAGRGARGAHRKFPDASAVRSRRRLGPRRSSWRRWISRRALRPRRIVSRRAIIAAVIAKCVLPSRGSWPVCRRAGRGGPGRVRCLCDPYYYTWNHCGPYYPAYYGGYSPVYYGGYYPAYGGGYYPGTMPAGREYRKCIARAAWSLSQRQRPRHPLPRRGPRVVHYRGVAPATRTSSARATTVRSGYVRGAGAVVAELSVRAPDRLKAVERALQDVGRRHLVDDFGARLRACVRVDQVRLTAAVDSRSSQNTRAGR